jgi:hypothetical protein
MFHVMNQAMINILGNDFRVSPLVISDLTLEKVTFSKCQNQTRNELWKFTKTLRGKQILSLRI